jgi:hypothetical protein
MAHGRRRSLIRRVLKKFGCSTKERNFKNRRLWVTELDKQQPHGRVFRKKNQASSETNNGKYERRYVKSIVDT